MDKIKTLNQGRALFRQSEGEKHQDRGREKVGSSFRWDERESGKMTICVVLL